MKQLVEEKVLSYSLKSKRNLERVLGNGVTPDYFHTKDNRAVFSALLDFFKKYRSLPGRDHLVDSILKSSNDPDLSGIGQVIDSFLLKPPETDEGIQYWIDRLTEARNARLVIKAMQEAADGISEGKSLSQVLSNLQSELRDIRTPSGLAGEKTLSINNSEFSEKRLDNYIVSRDTPEKVKVVHTGIRTLDAVIRGIRPGELCVFVGRHGSGKSVMLNTIAHNLFKAGKNVLLAGLEMSQEINAMRFDALFAFVSYSRLRDGRMSEEEEERYQEALKLMTLYPNKYYIIPPSRCQTVQDIEREINLIQQMDNVTLDAILIDYLNILSSETISGSSGRRAIFEQQKILAEECRYLGYCYNTCVFTASQANRQAIDRQRAVYTEAIALSDFIGATADVVIRLIRGEQERMSNTLIADVIKHRHGWTNQVTLSCNFDKMQITDFDETQIKLKNEEEEEDTFGF